MFSSQLVRRPFLFRWTCVSSWSCDLQWPELHCSVPVSCQSSSLEDFFDPLESELPAVGWPWLRQLDRHSSFITCSDRKTPSPNRNENNSDVNPYPPCAHHTFIIPPWPHPVQTLHSHTCSTSTWSRRRDHVDTQYSIASPHYTSPHQLTTNHLQHAVPTCSQSWAGHWSRRQRCHRARCHQSRVQPREVWRSHRDHEGSDLAGQE